MKFLALCATVALCAANQVVPESTQIVPAWTGQGPRDLHREYPNIFKFGNRNAASHLWYSFVLERAPQMTSSRFEAVSSGYCAVSGSPVQPHERTRYMLRLDSVEGGGKKVAGFMYYCCWPCVCDTQDFLKVDTANVTLADGPKQVHVVVIGNPCDNPEALHKPFVQPFDGRSTTLARDAAEVRCDADGKLIGASLSDHGYPIVQVFYDAEEVGGDTARSVVPGGVPTPGRTGVSNSGLRYQDEYEYSEMCTDRAAHGYNSGMGEIFRKVAGISKIVPGSRPRLPLPAASGTEDGANNQSDL